MEEPEVQVETVSVESVIAEDRASIDTQVATAKKYPRNVTRAIDNSVAIVTRNEKIAQTCVYALPRAGKVISGPSVHLANVLSQNWGNLRVESKVVGMDATHVDCQAVCWDIENNLAIKVTVKRRITDSKGKRFNEDMITVTGNAGNAIARRNAILSVIPRGVVDEVYEAAQGRITGDVSDANKLKAKVKSTFDKIKDSFEVSEKEILAMLGKPTVAMINAQDLVTLSGAIQAIVDGDSTVDEQFRPEWVKAKGQGDNATAKAHQAVAKAAAQKEAEKK